MVLIAIVAVFPSLSHFVAKRQESGLTKKEIIDTLYGCNGLQGSPVLEIDGTDLCGQPVRFASHAKRSELNRRLFSRRKMWLILIRVNRGL